MDPERRLALLQVKLGALVRDAFGVTGGAPSPFPGGAALRAGDVLHVLFEDARRSIGPALVIAQRDDAKELRVLTVHGAPRLAHQAMAFRLPTSVWLVDDATLHATEPDAPADPVAPPDAAELAGHLRAAGLDVVAESGRLAGEVRGLEVARVRAAAPGEAPGLEVGVGQADRELTAMLHGGLAPDAALARVVEVVDAVRRPGAEPHPLNRLAPERWLRWVLRGEPDRVGAVEIEPVPSPHPRSGLRERDVACATATLGDGSPAVIVASVGVDIDLVPLAADARALAAPEAELVLALPARDVHRSTTGLASALVRPARVVPIEGDWRTR
jgi:hypothetical protein